jgi:hypothetical protein
VSYYTGDPGFFSIVKSLAGSALGLVPGGGAIRTVARTAGGLLARGGGMARSAGQVAKAGILRNPRLTAAGAAAGVAAAGYGVGRVSKKDQIRMAAGLPFRRHRRMRVTNPKALHRALRRAHGFAKLAMRTIHLIHPRKKVRFGGFKKRRRK